jgi:CelD/BcsL family acetyltransferase involved in cellulose biosynthesis
MRSTGTARREAVHDEADERSNGRSGDAAAGLRDTPVHPTPIVAGLLRVTVFDTIEAAEAPWRALEKTAILTPYQRYEWVKALLASRGLGGQCAIAVVDQGGAPVAALPLVVASRWGIKLAEPIGADINNTGWMIVDPAFSQGLGRSELDFIFAEIGKATGADLVALYNQPLDWQGLANPLLAFPHQPGPDHFYCGPLSTDKLSNNRIRNILRGRRRLGETMGPVSLRRATTPEDIDTYHEAFLRQRGARFAELGIANVFAEDWFVRLFKAAALQSLGAEQPILRFHALYAGDQILATALGTYSGNHYSQYINSTATEGPAVKYSLIAILLHELVEELNAEGVTSIDIGLGDFAYKELWTEKLTVYDSVIALSGKGGLSAPLLRSARALKRTIKQDKRLFELAKGLRALVQRRGAPGAGATSSASEDDSGK